jgi:restriction endonuclease S subunit
LPLNLKYFLKTQLKNIASIQAGIFAQTIISGQVSYLQAKHFKENGQLIESVFPDLSHNNQTEKHLLNDGDILFAAKGSKNFATQFERKYGNCVASSTFLVIRINKVYNNKILPEFLCWYLNNPKTQEWLKNKAKGSSIPLISKMDLQEIEISIPPIEKQKNIIKIHSLQKAEQSLLKKIQDLKDQYIQQRLNTIINYKL